MKKSIIITLLVFLAPYAYAQIITTIAGGITGHGGYWGDGGPATAAELWGPVDIAIDSRGNLYIGDGQINRIRKVDLTTGIITTYAGTGVAGYSGDGYPATDAKLYWPDFIALDEFDNLYICDALNNRVRKVDAITKIITTFAGNGVSASTGDWGQATAASIRLGGVACDRHGNVYVGDYDKVRKIDPSGIITTVAGDGLPGITIDGTLATATHLGLPQSICTDATGNVYIADSTFAIRKLTVSTGIISRVAGVGDGGGTYGGDGIPATTCHLITFGVKTDNAGNIYNAGYGNQRVVKIDAAGIIHTVAGTGAGTGGFSGDGGAATTAQLKYPKNIAFDACGNMYIADFSNKRIRKVTYPPILTMPTISITGITSISVGSTVTVNATVASAGSSYIIHWMNHGLEFTTTTGPTVTYTKPPGIDTITARVVSTATYGCYDSTTSAVHIVSDAVTEGIMYADERIIIHPNPVNNELHIEGSDAGSYRLVSIVGAVVQEGRLQKGSNTIPVKEMPGGVYILEVKQASGSPQYMRLLRASQ